MEVGVFKQIRRAMVAAVFALPVAAAVAAPYPDKPINLVVPYSAGGAVDTVGRILGQVLNDRMSVSVVVENKGGFSGNVGAQYVARSSPDGYTLLMAALTSYALNAKLMGEKTVGYSLANDFKPVAIVGKLPVALVVNSSLPADTLPELIDYLKKNPGKIAFGSSGPGSLEHAAGELFKMRAGVDILHVPYKGAAPAMVDLMSNQIQLMFATTPTTVANLSSGRIKVIGVASDKPVAVLPKAATLASQGLKGVEATSLYGVLAPKGTPDDVIAKLNDNLQKGLQDPEVRKKLSMQGVEVVSTTPQSARSMMQAEVDKWSQVIDKTHITLSN